MSEDEPEKHGSYDDVKDGKFKMLIADSNAVYSAPTDKVNQMNNSGNSSRGSRKSLPPGSQFGGDSTVTEKIFKLITNNESNKLQRFLEEMGAKVNVVDMFESRKYSTLAFCAFKNHDTCFHLILEHGKKYNLKSTSLVGHAVKEELSKWAN